jgi:hypothetical protein
MLKNIVNVPSQSNFKSADSLIFPNIMYQMTIENYKKTKDPTNITKLLNQDELNMLYCIPESNFKTFKASIVDNKDRIINNAPHRKFVLNIKPSLRQYHTACRWLLKFAK